MLEFYFSYRGVHKRLRDGALGAEMDRGILFLVGFKRASAKHYLSRIARFSHFAAAYCGSGAGPFRMAVLQENRLVFEFSGAGFVFRNQSYIVGQMTKESICSEPLFEWLEELVPDERGRGRILGETPPCAGDPCLKTCIPAEMNK